MTVHDFNDDLAWSHAQSDAPWWGTIYRQAFPNLLTMADVRKDGWAQRGGIDRVLTLDSGKTLNIDEKVRRKNYGDIALEYWSDEARKQRGWIAKDLACDYIAYAIVPTATCYLLPFLQLRQAWRDHRREWVARYPKIPAPNNGYTTISVGIPPGVLLDAIRDTLVLTWQKEAA